MVAPGTGGKRPVTVTDGKARPAGERATPLTGVFIHRRYEDRTPVQPHAPNPRRPVTVILPKPESPPDARAEEDVGEATSTDLLTEAPLALEAPPEEGPAAESPQALVLVEPDRGLSARLSRADLEDLREFIDEAVRRALEQAALPAAADAQSAVSVPPEPLVTLQRRTVAGIGAALLVGGAAADVVAAQWDIWVRGATVSSVGWLQATGLVGAALITGAGAAVVGFAWLAGGARRAKKPAAP
jgi:hypothetical protein